jgi:tetratricopeptide (TPR) repeat protein
MMKCIDEWDYENEIESLEEDIRKRSMEVRPPNDKLTTEAGWNKWKADPLKNLADLYATCPEEKFRNGDKAVSLAHKACELTNYQNSDIVNVLAAAYAECSNFDKAIEYQNKAIKLVEEKDYQIWPEDAERLRDYKEHLAAYKQKKPWRQKST